nr:MAG TPA: hypothetical protein [Caudoviricetes sp.]
MTKTKLPKGRCGIQVHRDGWYLPRQGQSKTLPY